MRCTIVFLWHLIEIENLDDTVILSHDPSVAVSFFERDRQLF